MAFPVERGLLDWAIPRALTDSHLYGKPDDNFDCKSQHNPVIMLAGLSANDQVDLNQLQFKLNDMGYCTFSKTYGAHTLAPWIGGLTSMDDSAKEIAAFINEVQSKTGASKVDLVGHSEGGVMSIYVPLTQSGIADKVGRAIALGPAIHGAAYFGFTDLWYIGGDLTRKIAATALKTLGCSACDDMATDGAVYKVFKDAAGHIAQKGIKTSIIMSKSDTLVPVDVSRIEEEGVRNIVVQDSCPDDQVGHAGLAWDESVWGIIINELQETYDQPVTCGQGLKF